MNLNRTIFNYSLLSLSAFAFNKLYSFFGHGVTSQWMANMFAYLLGLGVGVFILIKVFIPDIVTMKGYRLFYNTYNSGIAILINGMLLKGILEIAGATSGIVQCFLFAGCGLILAGAVMGCMVIKNRPKESIYCR